MASTDPAPAAPSAPAPAPAPRVASTQSKYPLRAVARTVLSVVIAAAAVIPVAVSQAHLSTSVYPWLAGVLAVCAAVTRALANPVVEEFLHKYRLTSLLAAAPAQAPADAPNLSGDKFQ